MFEIIELKKGWFIRKPIGFRQIDMLKCRFDPKTMAIAAIAGGTGLSVYSALEEGKEAVKAGKQEKRQLNQEALAVRQTGAYEAGVKATEQNEAISTAIAQINANGGLVTGSKLRNLVKMNTDYEADKRMIVRNAGLEASKLRQAGAWAVYQGRIARRASRIRATTEIAKGVAMAAMEKNRKKKKNPAGSFGSPAGSSGQMTAQGSALKVGQVNQTTGMGW